MQHLAEVLWERGEPEVGDLHPPLPVEEDVLRLDVPVAHPALVAVRHAVDELLEEGARLVLRQAGCGGEGRGTGVSAGGWRAGCGAVSWFIGCWGSAHGGL